MFLVVVLVIHWHLIFWGGFGSLRTSLLWLVGEIAGEGSVVVVFGVSDR